MELRRLEEIDFKGKSVLLRLDLNVPIKKGVITDATRIEAALPTIRYILERTNKVALCSHLGRPDGEKDPAYSLEPVGAQLADLLGKEVVFVDDYVEEPASHVVKQLAADQFILFENLRFHPGETKNDPAFARAIMRGFEFYVDDAFGAVHRAHASTVGAAELVLPEKRAAGLLIQKEVSAFNSVMKSPKAPFTLIMGGAKVSDKIGVILNLLNMCNNLLIGGAMAYTFLKFRGANIGASKYETDKMDQIEAIYRTAEQRKVKIELPIDHIGAEKFDEKSKAVAVDSVNIPKNLMGLDIGPKTAQHYAAIIAESKTVVWNGPMGVFEWPAFARGTMEVAKAMAGCNGLTIVGGGDSVSAVNKAQVAEKISHISTGGGASLEYLEGQILPGLSVLYK